MPIVPYLFILCAKGLSKMISGVVQSGVMEGLRVAIGSPVILHLFFANNSLLFVRPVGG